MRRRLEETTKSFIPAALYMSYKKRKEVRTGEPELNLLGHLMGQGRRAVDVGASRGLFSYFMAKHANAVEAFEPIDYLRAAARRFLPANVTLHGCALSSASGRGRLHIPISGSGRDKHILSSLGVVAHPFQVRTIDVEIRTLDSFAFNNVGLIKIDVEGYELAVLEGAADTIARSRPTIVAELLSEYYENPGQAVREIIGRFQYEAVVLFRSQLHRFDYYTTHFSSLNIMGSIGSTRNVVFLPR
jgi:FkbM family methyltransferase